ncbi:hypothetical protein [Microbacterium marmarense]|uniref:DUF4913 domain-containing protein n=1 Tax=Microbacterium marmarense TaxID=3122051 RepID=A0ABU8LSW6_9MICO
MNEREDYDAVQHLSNEMAAGPDPYARAGSADAIGGHTVNWSRLSDDSAQTEWIRLREWVEWFTVRYTVPVSVVPNCWWKHGALVEELSALWIAHLAAFDTSDTGLGAIGWHERLALAQSRLQRAGAGCASTHNETRPRSWVNATDEQEWNAWVAQTHAH